MRPPAAGRPAASRPEVLEADPGRKLRWLWPVSSSPACSTANTAAIQPTGPGGPLTSGEFRVLLALVAALIAKPMPKFRR